MIVPSSERTSPFSVVSRSVVAEGAVEIVLSPVQGAAPSWAPGAHIDLQAGGFVRQYSLCGQPADRCLKIAVLHEPASRGGSAYIHDRIAVGDEVAVGGPRNHFGLVDAAAYLFIAGGIGITPIIAMIHSAEVAERPWKLEYGGRTLSSMAYLEDLRTMYGDRVRAHPADVEGILNLPALLGDEVPGRAVYACGPEPLLKALEEIMATRSSERLHLERFAPKTVEEENPNGAFEVILASSGEHVPVGADESIIDALSKRGITVPFSCREGICGTCETPVLAGVPDHRDSVLDDEEQAQGDCMMICVSRATSPTLTLNI